MGRINLLTSSVFYYNTISRVSLKILLRVLLPNLYPGVIETAKTKITKGRTKEISNFLTQ